MSDPEKLNTRDDQDPQTDITIRYLLKQHETLDRKLYEWNVWKLSAAATVGAFLVFFGIKLSELLPSYAKLKSDISQLQEKTLDISKDIEKEAILQVAKAILPIPLDLRNPTPNSKPSSTIHYFIETQSLSTPLISLISDPGYSPPPVLMAIPMTYRSAAGDSSNVLHTKPGDPSPEAKGVRITLHGNGLSNGDMRILAKVALLQPGAVVFTNALSAYSW